jgi:hypothetical protein
MQLPPPISEQKRQRQANPSIIPGPPYLLLSKALDYTCTSLLLPLGICPSINDGGWRALVPNEEWVTFPYGKLSHSFEGYYSAEDVMPELTFGEFVRARRNNINSNAAADISTSTTYTTNTYSSTTLVVDMYDYATQTNSTALSNLTNNEAMFVLLLLVLLLRQVKSTCLPQFAILGRKLGQAAHGPQWTKYNTERIIKFAEYVYRLFYHTSVSIYGIYYFHNKVWWKKGKTANLWINHPNQPIEPCMTWYYLVQAAYNVDALVSLVELSFVFRWVNPLIYSSAIDFYVKEHVVDEGAGEETTTTTKAVEVGVPPPLLLLWTPIFTLHWSTTVRGDFREMMAHHIVTNTLIFFSSYYRLTRVGSMVFLIHDISDVPIDMSKLANFVKWRVTTIVCFFIMVLLWVVTRLTIFPFVICGSVITESYEYLVVRGSLDPALHDAYYLFFYALLGALVMLHVTWFVILLRIGWTLVTTGERHDYTEHKSGEMKQHLTKKEE